MLWRHNAVVENKERQNVHHFGPDRPGSAQPWRGLVANPSDTGDMFG